MTRCHNYADALTHYIRAGKNEITDDELRELANSAIDRIRMRVAENPRCPVDVLQALAKDSSPDVRSAVAVNPSTPKDLLWQLCSDEDPTVRFSLAEDPHLDEQILQCLAQDNNGYVRWRAEKTLGASHGRKRKVQHYKLPLRPALQAIKNMTLVRHIEYA